MSKIGFWESLVGDISPFERDAINETHEQMERHHASQTQSTAELLGHTRRLFALDHAQSKELARLRAMVRVLAETLVELGADSSVLEQRMEQALDALESPEAMRGQVGFNPDGGPLRGNSDVPPAPEPMTRCRRCSEEVLARRTQITEDGNVCDRCYY